MTDHVISSGQSCSSTTQWRFSACTQTTRWSEVRCLNRSATVVGVSNFFVKPGPTAATWSGCLALAGELYPATAVVGYESGDELATAQDHGFETAGPLRVWINDG